MAFHEVRFPTADLARRQRRPRAAHRYRRARLRPRGAQQPLGRLAPQLQCRLRHQAARRPARRHRLLRGAARAPARLPLARTMPTANRAAPSVARHRARPGDRHRRRRAGDFQLDEDLRRRACALPAADHEARRRHACWSPSPARRKSAGTHFTVDHDDRPRQLSRRARPGGRRSRHRRLRVRRAGPLRHRQARGQPPELRGTAPSRQIPIVEMRTMKIAPCAACKPISTRGATTLCWCWRVTRATASRSASPTTTAISSSTAPPSRRRRLHGDARSAKRSGLGVDDLEVEGALARTGSTRRISPPASTTTPRSRSCASTGRTPSAARADPLGLDRRGAARAGSPLPPRCAALRISCSSEQGRMFQYRLRRRSRRRALRHQSDAGGFRGTGAVISDRRRPAASPPPASARSPTAGSRAACSL